MASTPADGVLGIVLDTSYTRGDADAAGTPPTGTALPRRRVLSRGLEHPARGRRGDRAALSRGAGGARCGSRPTRRLCSASPPARPGAASTMLLALHDLGGHFVAPCRRRTTIPRSRIPRCSRRARRGRASLAEAVMSVSDTEFDMAMGEQRAFCTIGVTGAPRARLAAAGADRVIGFRRARCSMSAIRGWP